MSFCQQERPISIICHKKESFHVKIYPYEKDRGGGAEKVLALLKAGGGGHKALTHSLLCVFFM